MGVMRKRKRMTKVSVLNSNYSGQVPDDVLGNGWDADPCSSRHPQSAAISSTGGRSPSSPSLLTPCCTAAVAL